MASKKALLLVGLVVGWSLSLFGQATPRQMQILHQTAAKFSPKQRQNLSSAGHLLLHLADTPKAFSNVQAPPAYVNNIWKSAQSNMQKRAQAEGQSGSKGPVHVSAPELDYAFSRMAGITQSETSSAWCGNNVVVGFNDSGAYLRTRIAGGGYSFSGVAYSTNAGKSFIELPNLTTGPHYTFLVGDPVIACSDPKSFWYSSLYETYTPPTDTTPEQAGTAIAVNLSNTGGSTWGTPIAAVTKDGFSHFLDKEWMAVDPFDPRNVYITYTDFDGSNSVCYGPRSGIEMVASHDGGLTWSAPIDIDSPCIAEGRGVGSGSAPTGQMETWFFTDALGSQVVVGNNGEIWIAYVEQGFFGGTQYIRKSTDHGQTFGDPIAVADYMLPGSPGELQGLIRVNSFPSLAVDRSKGPSRGTLYMAWADATNNAVFDWLTLSGTYQLGDIVMSKSTDGGQTWAPAVTVSPMPQGATPRDQFMPGVAVDSTGKLAVCYSDRRNDPNNFMVDHYCSVSSDHGATFSDVRETPSSFFPTHDNDFYVNIWYMGDYDATSNDLMGVNPGFFNSFQYQTNQNPDVYGMRVK